MTDYFRTDDRRSAALALRDPDEEWRSVTRRLQGEKPTRAKRALLIALTGLLFVIGGAALAVYVVVQKFDGQIERQDVFGDLDESTRPERASSGDGAHSVNILMAGLDARSDDGERLTGEDAGDDWRTARGERTDTMMILHVPADRTSAYLISIPRDSWIDIPGKRMAKANAAYSWGGPELYVQTVEQLTNVRMDHFAVIDWVGFAALTDALGGVELSFDEEIQFASGAVHGPGSVTLDGTGALDYVRARKNLPDGDFDRVRRQQNFLRSLVSQTASRGTSRSHINDVLNAITRNMSVNTEFSFDEMFGLAWSLQGIDTENIQYLTLPTKGTGWEGDQSVVYLDEEAAEGLFEAMREGGVTEWLGEQEDDSFLLGDNVR